LYVFIPFLTWTIIIIHPSSSYYELCEHLEFAEEDIVKRCQFEEATSGDAPLLFEIETQSAARYADSERGCSWAEVSSSFCCFATAAASSYSSSHYNKSF
jgi:hypothetical protein